MPMSAGDLAGELRTNLDTLKWCLEMTAHIHQAPFHDRLVDNSRLSHPEIDAVRAEFGHLTGSQIEAEFADRQGHLDKAHDELSRLISTTEAAERCGVSESTIRGWVHRKKLTPVEYRELYPGETRINQIDVHRANQASQAKAAAVARRPQPRFTDREEALNQLTAAVPACLEAGLTDIPLLVQQIIDSADLDQH
jgi:excisionase family DNA binding protein